MKTVVLLEIAGPFGAVHLEMNNFTQLLIGNFNQLKFNRIARLWIVFCRCTRRCRTRFEIFPSKGRQKLFSLQIVANKINEMTSRHVFRSNRKSMRVYVCRREVLVNVFGYEDLSTRATEHEHVCGSSGCVRTTLKNVCDCIRVFVWVCRTRLLRLEVNRRLHWLNVPIVSNRTHQFWRTSEHTKICCKAWFEAKKTRTASRRSQSIGLEGGGEGEEGGAAAVASAISGNKRTNGEDVIHLRLQTTTHPPMHTNCLCVCAIAAIGSTRVASRDGCTVTASKRRVQAQVHCERRPRLPRWIWIDFFHGEREREKEWHTNENMFCPWTVSSVANCTQTLVNSVDLTTNGHNQQLFPISFVRFPFVPILCDRTTPKINQSNFKSPWNFTLWLNTHPLRAGNRKCTLLKKRQSTNSSVLHLSLSSRQLLHNRRNISKYWHTKSRQIWRR